MKNKTKYIILGVASSWCRKKGLDVFIELSERLPENYKVVIVGTDEVIDKDLPNQIISIHRTNSQNELAELYSSADIFINPTREDTFPTTNIEALASGTPVITYNVGGSPEILDASCGRVIVCNDVDDLEKNIISICENRPFSREACIRRAKMFDKNERFQEYVDLFEEFYEN